MKKAFTFLPGHRSDRQESESGGTSSTLFKRREQLRKAQRTHRLRKDQYFKNLESEVLRLRANEMKLVLQVQNLRSQIDVLHGIVDKQELSVLPAAPFIDLKAAENAGVGLTVATSPVQYHGNIQNGISSWGSRVGTESEETNSPLGLSGENIYPNSHGQLIGSANGQQPDLPFRAPAFTSPFQPMEPQSRCAEKSSNQKMTDMGMEFVLALEHPCLPHLERHPDKPNGHSLLTSATLVHSHDHQYASSMLSKYAPSTYNPAFIFDKLLALSEELVLDDELSPTQAWCYILQQSWVNNLDGVKLRELSASLLKLIKCHGSSTIKASRYGV
ncbi:uncharacterized protein N7498_007774 [Penicillium cinerascens]|uniref:BZIP domain-containing protein n=1 Tax=Penicillium cinerascens TaxID=70096 RepID=A0A9W9JMH9_9EURO|nr:uncharacterized protein N7498_007774 [Penicillium cinerascens]KAJ5198657.1 hypothetical protein N7498_007774 [Penicillium cinerascens]